MIRLNKTLHQRGCVDPDVETCLKAVTGIASSFDFSSFQSVFLKQYSDIQESHVSPVAGHGIDIDMFIKYLDEKYSKIYQV